MPSAVTPAAPLQPEIGPGGHAFNDDLLIREESLNRAQREHPELFHVLNHDALRNEFVAADGVANTRKRRSQVAGFWAVVAVLVSLLGVATEPIWHETSEGWSKVIAAVFASIGIFGIAVAAWGLLYGEHKHEWLRQRLKTERFRQFQFQTFVFRITEILDSLASNQAKADYERRRGDWFQEFKVHLSKDRLGLVHAVTNPGIPPTIWVHGDTRTTPEWPTTKNRPIPEALFKAYATFRFEEQIAYADYMLRPRNERPAVAEADDQPLVKKKRRPWYPGIDQPIHRKRTFLRHSFRLALALLLGVHAAVLLGSIFDIMGMPAVWAGAVILSAALVSVASKTLKEGLALDRDWERYQEYRAAVTDLLNRFNSTQDSMEKHRLMVEMERVAYEEMRTFLRSHEDATFVM